MLGEQQRARQKMASCNPPAQPVCDARLLRRKNNRAASIQWNVVSLIFSFDVTKIRLSLAVCFDSFSTVTHPEKSVVASAARIYPCDRVPYLGYRFGCVGSRGRRSTRSSCSLGGQQLGSAQIGARGSRHAGGTSNSSIRLENTGRAVFRSGFVEDRSRVRHA